MSAGPNLAWAKADIPVLDLRSLSCLEDVTRTFKPTNAQWRMYRAEVGIANAIP